MERTYIALCPSNPISPDGNTMCLLLVQQLNNRYHWYCYNNYTYLVPVHAMHYLINHKLCSYSLVHAVNGGYLIKESLLHLYSVREIALQLKHEL